MLLHAKNAPESARVTEARLIAEEVVTGHLVHTAGARQPEREVGVRSDAFLRALAEPDRVVPDRLRANGRHQACSGQAIPGVVRADVRVPLPDMAVNMERAAAAFAVGHCDMEAH